MSQRCILVPDYVGSPLAFRGCRQSSRNAIGVDTEVQAHHFWKCIHAKAVAAGRVFGYDIFGDGRAGEKDYARQMHTTQSTVGRRVEERHQVMGAGIAVTVYDSPVDNDDGISFLGTHNHASGQEDAGRLAPMLNGKGNTFAIRHRPCSEAGYEISWPNAPENGRPPNARDRPRGPRSGDRGAGVSGRARIPELDLSL